MKYLIAAVFIFSPLLGFTQNKKPDQIINEAIKHRSLDGTEYRIGARGAKPRQHVVDPYRIDRQNNKDKFYSKCKEKKFKSFYEKHDCIKGASKEFNELYPDRGTDGYGDMFYKSLSDLEATKKRNELLKHLDTVSYYPKEENKETELNVSHVEHEIYYIERYVLEIVPRAYETR